MRSWLVGVCVVLTVGCSPGDTPVLLVGAASSLQEALVALDDAYAGADLDVSVAGSQVLVSQVREGAPLDVVLTADERSADRMAALGVLADAPVRFAGNRLAIVVARHNPLAISTLADLTNPALTIVLAAPEVPAGRYTGQLLQRAGLDLTVASYEASVRGVLTKVELGEADAGIVYRTDIAVGAVEGIPIDPAINPATAYYAAIPAGTDQPGAAAAFVAFLRSTDAAQVLESLGFEP